MEASGHQLTAAIHPYEGMTKSPLRRVHIRKTMRMGPYEATSRPKCNGYIGRMNMQKSHRKRGNEPCNYATWRVYPSWRIPPVRKRRRKTEGSKRS